MTFAEKMSEGVVVLGVGVMVVFGVLILLWGLLALMRVFFYDLPKKQKAPKKDKKPAEAVAPKEVAPAQPVQEEDDEELIAVIAAAIAAAMNTSAHNLKIKSVRRVSNWNK